LIFSRASASARTGTGVAALGVVVSGAGVDEGLAAGDEQAAITHRIATQAAGRRNKGTRTVAHQWRDGLTRAQRGFNRKT
jgi:hypothetical protein